MYIDVESLKRDSRCIFENIFVSSRYRKYEDPAGTGSLTGGQEMNELESKKEIQDHRATKASS